MCTVIWHWTLHSLIEIYQHFRDACYIQNFSKFLYGMFPKLLVVAAAKSHRSHNKILPYLGDDCFLHNFCQCNINQSSHLLTVWCPSYWHLQTRRQRKVMMTMIMMGDDVAAAAANGIDSVICSVQVWLFSQLCNWGFWSCGMWHSIIMWVVPDVLKECRVCACERACACPRDRLDCCVLKPHIPLKRQEPLTEQCREPGSSMYTLPTVLLISFLYSVVIWLHHLLLSFGCITFCCHLAASPSVVIWLRHLSSFGCVTFCCHLAAASPVVIWLRHLLLSFGCVTFCCHLAASPSGSYHMLLSSLFYVAAQLDKVPGLYLGQHQCHTGLW